MFLSAEAFAIGYPYLESRVISLDSRLRHKELDIYGCHPSLRVSIDPS